METKANEHRGARKFIKGINSVISYIEVIVLLSLLIFGIYAIWDNTQIDNENTASEYEMYKPTAKDTRTYDDFLKVNPDVCGWLTVNDTGIDYPLVHGEDNDEYMNKTADLQFALSGSLFLNYLNQPDFSDRNTIIYGHHMEGPSMFGVLDQYVKEDFFNAHEDGLLYYEGQWHELDIFAFLEVDAYDQEIYSIAEDDASYAEYLEYIRANASQYRDVGVTTQDHIIVMSTCMTDKTNGRYIVTAKIGGITDGPQSEETERSYARDGLSPQTLNLIFACIGGLIIFLLILIYLLYRRHKRKKEQARRKSMERGNTMAMSENEENSKSMNAARDNGVDLTRQGSRKARAAQDNPPKKKKKGSLGSDLINLLIRLAIIAAIIWVIFSFVFGLFINSGVAMEPSVQDRDIIIFYRLDNEYTANEAVVYEADGEERLGRIVARGGDTVEITEDGLKVNGYLQQDYKNTGETLAVQDGIEYPITLAEDEFFILGDNREESTDSRMFGPVRLDDIKGSVLTVLRRRDV